MAKFRPNPNLKLMDQVREVLRYHHYAYRTQQTYCNWILRYIQYFGGKTHPILLGARDIERFLSDLVTEGKARPPRSIPMSWPETSGSWKVR